MKTFDTSEWGIENLPQNEDNNIDTFPEEWKEEFEGLLYVGYLQREVTRIPFHKFVVKTLTVNEKLEISLIVKTYAGTIGESRAWKAAVVAAGLLSVDGTELIASNKKINTVRQKYEYVTTNWYDTVVDLLYDEIEALEYRVVIVLQELGIINPIVDDDIFEESLEGVDIPKDGK